MPTTDTPKDLACLNLNLEKIKPDVRVAYTEGLVLGVDEFVQEQRYLLEKDYLHNRGLHGYGTVYGLALSIAKSKDETEPTPKPGQPPPPKPRSVDFDPGQAAWIKISAGVGVDQRGRTFVLRKTYCANLTEWFNDLKTKPALVEAKDNIPAHYPIYIRARYDETCGDLVILAGQACSSKDVNSANSRIYDSVLLQFGSTKPVMSAWDLARRFSWFMSQIRIVPGIEYDTLAEAALLTYVRQWLADNDSYDDQFKIELDNLEKRGKPRYFQLPEGSTQTANLLEKLRLAYVTDVAPKGHLVDAYESPQKEDDNDILLTQINLVPAAGDNNGANIHTVTLVEDERPYLLGTQTFQELASLSKRDKNRRRLFASLHVKSSTSLLLWMHYQNIKLPSTLDTTKLILKSDGAALDGSVTQLTDQFYTINLTTSSISLGAPVELTFKLGQLKDKTDITLEADNLNEYVGLNPDGSDITVYTFADNLMAVRSLAAVTVRRNNSQLIMNVGFNVGSATAITVTNAWQVLVANNTPLDSNSILNQYDANRRLLSLTLPPSVNDGDVLTLRLDTRAVRIGNDPLSTLMSNGEYTLVGYDGKQYVNLPCVVNAPIPYSDGDVKRVLEDTINIYTDPIELKLSNLRTLPFATITPINETGRLQFEVWLHSSLVAAANGDQVSLLTNDSLEIYAETANDPVRVPLDGPVILAPGCNNGFIVTTAINNDLSLKYLRFVFIPERITLPGTTPNSSITLSDFMTNKNLKFDGNYIMASTGLNAIVVYVRNSVVIPVPLGDELREVPQVQVQPAAPPAAINALAEAAPKAAPKTTTRKRRSGGKG